MSTAEETFISSTMWTDKLGPAAAIAMIKKYEKNKVSLHLLNVGKKIQDGWILQANKHQLKIKISGIYALSHFTFEYKDSLKLKTLFTQLLLEEGFLATTAFYASYAHKEAEIIKYLKATDKAFAFLKKVMNNNTLQKHLKGPACDDGFRRLT